MIFLIILLLSVDCVIIFLYSFLILVIYTLSIVYWSLWLELCLFYWSFQGKAFSFTYFSTDPFSILVIFPFSFTIVFFPLLDSIWSFFSFLCWELKLLFEIFLLFQYKAINIPLSTDLDASCKFMYFVFSFKFALNLVFSCIAYAYNSSFKVLICCFCHLFLIPGTFSIKYFPPIYCSYFPCFYFGWMPDINLLSTEFYWNPWKGTGLYSLRQFNSYFRSGWSCQDLFVSF